MTQLDFFHATPSVPALSTTAPTFLADGTPDLPQRVALLALWWDFAALVMGGWKPIETRTWEPRPPFAPGWLAICASLGRGPLKKRPMLPPGVPEPAPATCPRQALTGLVWVASWRPLVKADMDRACYYEPGLVAWELAKIIRIPRPIPLAEIGLAKAPQNFTYIDRGHVLRALSPCP